MKNSTITMKREDVSKNVFIETFGFKMEEMLKHDFTIFERVV